MHIYDVLCIVKPANNETSFDLSKTQIVNSLEKAATSKAISLSDLDVHPILAEPSTSVTQDTPPVSKIDKFDISGVKTLKVRLLVYTMS